MPARLADVSPGRWQTILRDTRSVALWHEGLALLATQPYLAEGMARNTRLPEAERQLFVDQVGRVGPWMLRSAATRLTLDPWWIRALWTLGPEWQQDLLRQPRLPLDLVDALLAGPEVRVRGRSLQLEALRRAPLGGARLGELLLATRKAEWVEELLRHPATDPVCRRRWLRRYAADRGAGLAGVPIGTWSRRDVLRGESAGQLDVRAFALLVQQSWLADLLAVVDTASHTVPQRRLLLRRLARLLAADGQLPAGQTASDVRWSWGCLLARSGVDPAWPELQAFWTAIVRSHPEEAMAWLQQGGRHRLGARLPDYVRPLLTHPDRRVRVEALGALAAFGQGGPGASPAPGSTPRR